MRHRILIACATSLALAIAIHPAFSQEGPIGTTGFASNQAFPSLSGIVLRTRLLPTNEIPPLVSSIGSGWATIRVLRSGNGQNNVVEFTVDHDFSTEVSITGLHIHAGSSTENGPIVIDSGIQSTSPIVAAAGKGTIRRQVTLTTFDVNGLIQSPENFYVNIHTTLNPGGVMRGSLQQTEQVIAAAILSPANEVPPVQGQDVFAAGVVTATMTRDGVGNVTSAEVDFRVDYRVPVEGFFTPNTNFTGLHIHKGAAGTNGPVILDSALVTTAADASGSGTLRSRNVVDVSKPEVLEALEALSQNPNGFYMNLHTSSFPGGVVRGQVAPTDRIVIGVNLRSPGSNGPEGDGAFIADVVRDRQGNITAGLATFAVLQQGFPTGTVFTGLHIHEGPENGTGPIRIDSGISGTNSVAGGGAPGVVGASAVLVDRTSLEALQAMLTTVTGNAVNYYMNLHTVVAPAGAIRGQMGNTGGVVTDGKFATINVVASAIGLDPPMLEVAPSGLMSIFGSFFVAEGGATTAAGQFLSYSINGVRVKMDGGVIPLVRVTRGEIIAQVPYSMGTGTRDVVVTLLGETQSSDPVSVTVLENAPGIFITDGGNGRAVGNVRKGSAEGGLVLPDNPVRANDLIVVYCTGFGQTTPNLFEGTPAPFENPAVTEPVTATIGDRAADVVSSIARPGYWGQYVVTIRVPSGLTSGDQPLELTVKEGVSNRVPIAITTAAP